MIFFIIFFCVIIHIIVDSLELIIIIGGTNKMSMSTSIVYGKGCQIQKSPKICEFILNHKETLMKGIEANTRAYELLEELINDAKKMISDQLYENYYYFEGRYSSDEGLENIIADVISIETDVRVQFNEHQDNGKKYILFSESLPWYLTDTEKNLTEDSLTDILKKYFGELDIPVELEDLKLEYFG